MNQKSIVITGSSSGIGAALARRLAGKVGSLTLHARHAGDKLAAVAAEVEAKGTQTTTLLCDLADAGSAESIVAQTQAKFGRLDAVVANAGFPLLTPFLEGSMEEIEYAFRGNLFSFFEMARCAHPLLKNADDARLIALGSFSAHVFRTDIKQFPLSAASKGGLETAVRSLAIEMCPDRINVNCVIPGYIRKDEGTRDGLTPEALAEQGTRIPMGRVGYPEEVAAVLEFLLSSDSSYVTGQCIHVNGGLI